MTREVEQVNQSDMALSRRDLMGSSAVVAAGALGVGMVGSASAQDGPTDEISGLVEDTDGNAVDGATVVAVPHDESLDALVTTTDASGEYSFQTADLHPNSNLYHVVARDGTESSPLRSRENYPFIAAMGETAIPDSGLYHRYDAIDGFTSGDEGVTTTSWPDGQGTADLSGGSPTVVGSGINSQRSVDFNQTDDKLSVTGLSISTPFTVFIVLDLTDPGTDQIPISEPGDSDHYLWWRGNWTLDHPGGSTDGSSDSSSQLFTMEFASSSAILREDGTESVNVSSSAATAEGIQLGAYYDDSLWFGGLIGEVAVYDPTASGYSRGDVEQYLADKWGIPI